MPRGPEQFSKFNEKPSELRGLPESWFKALIKVNSAFPQGFPADGYGMAPHFFRSIANREVTPRQAFTSKFSTEQLTELKEKADVQHEAFGVPPSMSIPVTDRQLAFIWTRAKINFSGLSSALINWENGAESGSPGRLPDHSFHFRDEPSKIDLLANEVEGLLSDPAHKDKLATIIQLAEAGAQSMETPESKATGAELRRQVREEHDFVICGHPALNPLYRNVEIAVERKALELKEQKGIIVPDYVKDWFRRG